MSKSSNKSAMREVLVFLFRHWRGEKWLIVWIALCMIVATAADLLMPLYSGRLVDALAMHAKAQTLAVHGAVDAIAMMACGFRSMWAVIPLACGHLKRCDVGSDSVAMWAANFDLA